MSSILIATEQTTGFDPVVSCGLALAEELHLPALVLHVLTSPASPQEREQIDRAAGGWANLGATPVIRLAAAGDEDQAIIEEARQASAEIIVLGAHRHALLRDIFGKSTVEDVIEDTDRKILVAAPKPEHSFRRVLLATDFSESSWRALTTTSRLFSNARIDVVHAWHVPFEGFLRSEQSREELETEAEAQMRSFLSRISDEGNRSEMENSLGTVLIREGETIRVVAQAVAELKSDLLVIATRGKGGVLRTRLGTTARAFLVDPPCNVLAIQVG